MLVPRGGNVRKEPYSGHTKQQRRAAEADERKWQTLGGNTSSYHRYVYRTLQDDGRDEPEGDEVAKVIGRLTANSYRKPEKGQEEAGENEASEDR